MIKHNGVEVDKINFIIDITPADLEITPVELTISTEGGSWVYDGIEHDNKDSFKCVGLPEIFTLEKSEEYPTVKNVIDGPKENRIDYVIKYNGEEVDKGNFNISETWGTLIIIPHELTVSTEGGSWTYDGEWHNNKDSFNHSDLPEGFILEVTDYAEIRDVKDSPMLNVIEYVITYNGEQADLSNFNVGQPNWGELVINPYHLAVSSKDKTWTYDGISHNYKESFEHSSLPNGHEIEVVSYAQIRFVDQSPVTNSIDYVIKYKGEESKKRELQKT